jgi:diguanylate cyclase (GGDEF)-like protein
MSTKAPVEKVGWYRSGAARDLMRHGSYYAVALLSPLLVLLAVSNSEMLRPSNLLVFVAGVMIVAWYGGLIPGLISAVESVFLIAYYLMLPLHSFEVHSNEDGARLVVFAWVAILVSSLNARRKRAEESLQKTQDRLKAALEAESNVARVDFLTGLANRRAFSERAETENARARRYRRPVTVAYIDIDDFKRVNDTQGHDAGDRLLVVVAKALQSHTRKTDILGRLGGDEFCILYPETDSEQARHTLEALHRTLSDALQRHGWTVTCSVGAASFPSGAEQTGDLIKKADEAMYAAKREGKNGFLLVPHPAVIPKLIARTSS